MHDHWFDDVPAPALLRSLTADFARESVANATLLGRIASADARRLHVPEGYSSMHAYCVDFHHLSEDEAYKRIQAARAARAFPELFVALAERRLHLTAIVLIAPWLSRENADEVIAAATHKRKVEIQAWLARRFGRAPEPALPLAGPASPEPASPEPASPPELVPEPVVPSLADLTQRLPPQSDGRVSFHARIRPSLRDKMQYAKALFAVPSGNDDELMERAYDLLIAEGEKQKFGASASPRAPRATSSPRRIPAHVKRDVWLRDGGRCTFTGASGHVCGATRLLEFDHVVPIARGGRTAADNIRLRCRAHNQYEAEKEFGADFMEQKRAEQQLERDVIGGLRSLGCRADEARRAVEATRSAGSLEERLRAALKLLRPSRVEVRPAPVPVERQRPSEGRLGGRERGDQEQGGHGVPYPPGRSAVPG